MDRTKRHTDGDEALFTGPFFKLEPGDLQTLAEAAKATHDSFQDIVKDMTEEQAEFIRHWRCGENGGTWRWVAERAYEAEFFGASWSSPSNQLMGMALCEKAASFFDEDYMSRPWN